MRYLPASIMLLMIMLLAACSIVDFDQKIDQSEALVFEDDLFGARQDPISKPAIYALSDSQRVAFRRYFEEPGNARKPAHQRVFDYLEAVTSNFSFRGETYTASEALRNSAGNCLSLAILTTALADLADVELAYQLTDTIPVFESSGDLISRGRHVRTMLFDPTWEPGERILVMSRPGIRVDYFPSKFDRFIGNVGESEYVAMYYNNIAADAVEKQDLSRAYWLLMESLKVSPNNPDSLNMLAIVYFRAGDISKSEEIYRFGIQHSTRQVSLLRNYGIFLRKQGRSVEASEIEHRLAQLDDPNPFDWFNVGQKAYRNGDFDRALTFFRKGVELAPYLHEGHFGLAKSHYGLGDRKNAARALEQAMSYAYQSSTRRLYEAKLAALNDG